MLNRGIGSSDALAALQVLGTLQASALHVHAAVWQQLTCPQMALAVALVSPVTTMTRMPAARQVASASATSSLGGSCIPTKPRKVSAVSSDTLICRTRSELYEGTKQMQHDLAAGQQARGQQEGMMLF